MKISIKETVSEVECLAVIKFTENISYSISVHKSGFNYVKCTFINMWNKKPTRCHLVLYLFLLYKLLTMFRATLCPSSGADDLVVFLPRVV